MYSVQPAGWKTGKIISISVRVQEIVLFFQNPLYRFPFNNQPDVLIIQNYSVIKLYMFRASSLPIIRNSLLYIRHWWFHADFDDRFQAESGWNLPVPNV
jgi:hypothetical protein